MRKRLHIILLLLSTTTFGQKTLESFDGTLIFKETRFFEPINRNHTDTVISYFSFDIGTKGSGSFIEIEQSCSCGNEYEDCYFIKFRFIKVHDSLFLNYRDPLTKKDIFQYFYPLNTRDTVSYRSSYKLCLDSILNADQTYSIALENYDNLPQFESTFLKDTTIAFKDYSFDCYLIEQNYNAIRNQTLIRKHIYIDKVSLIPVYEVEWVYAENKASRVPINKWVMTRQMKLIIIN